MNIAKSKLAQVSLHCQNTRDEDMYKKAFELVCYFYSPHYLSEWFDE